VRVVEAPRRRAPWTPEDVAVMEAMFEEGATETAVAKKLGRSVDAVRVRRKREGVPSRTATTLNARKVAQMLGLSCAKQVVRFRDLGYLRGRQVGRRGNNKQWLFQEDGVLAFMQDPRGWPGWKPERIPDPVLREWALELRKGEERTLSQAEVAELFHVDRDSVAAWLYRGHLPFVQFGRSNRRVPASALRGFVPPCDRPKGGYAIKRYSVEEDARLLELRAAGLSWSRVSAEMDRSLGSVHQRAARIGAR